MRETIFHIVFLNDDLSEAVNLISEEENGWKDDEGKQSFSWIDSGNTLHAKEKLIQILAREVFISKQI